MNSEDHLDRPIWGAFAIGRAAGVFERDKHGKVVTDENGEAKVDVRKAFHLIEIGVIPAKHVKGRNKDGKEKARGHLVSTQRQINGSLLPEATA